jgi:hypothetical protein
MLETGGNKEELKKERGIEVIPSWIFCYGAKRKMIAT